jgi:hypothetical protein
MHKAATIPSSPQITFRDIPSLLVITAASSVQKKARSKFCKCAARRTCCVDGKPSTGGKTLGLAWNIQAPGSCSLTSRSVELFQRSSFADCPPASYPPLLKRLNTARAKSSQSGVAAVKHQMTSSIGQKRLPIFISFRSTLKRCSASVRRFHYKSCIPTNRESDGCRTSSL